MASRPTARPRGRLRVRCSVALLLTGLMTPIAGHARPRSPGGDLRAVDGAFVASCETSTIDIGDPGSRGLLRTGFYDDEIDRDGLSFAWSRGEAEVVVVVLDPGERELMARLRAPAPGRAVEAFWNGHSLGRRDLRESWNVYRWPVPARATHTGPNRVRFVSSHETSPTASDGRRLGLGFEVVEITPAAACPPTGASASAPDSARPVVLSPGSVLVAPVLVAPRGRIDLEVSGEPGARLHVVSIVDDLGIVVGTVTVPTDGSISATFSLDSCCDLGAQIALISRGDGPAELVRAVVSGDTSDAGWRRGCGLLWLEVSAGLALLTLLIVSARRGWSLPFSDGRRAAFGMWFDVLVVLAVAVVLRHFYLAEYARVDARGFGDAWEYIDRARRLAGSPDSLLTSFGWHEWQTWIRPPGYYFFLSKALPGGGLETLAGLQSLFYCVGVVATYLLAYPLFGRGAALCASLGFAVYLEALVTTSFVMAESLYILFALPGLAALAWAAHRCSSRFSVLAGLLLGCATLVKSAPLIFTPLAAILLVVAHGFRRGRLPAVALVVAMLAVVLPWAIRNSLVAGRPTGIDTTAIPNLLLANPDPRILDQLGVRGDVETRSGRKRYYEVLKSSGETLAGERGIVRRALERMARDPARFAGHFRTSVGVYLRPFDATFIASFLGEPRPCRAAAMTDMLNAVYVATLLLGLAGVLLELRNRQAWPLLLWFVFTLAVVNLLFFKSDIDRYRYPTLPVMMAYAGAAVVRLHGMIGTGFESET